MRRKKFPVDEFKMNPPSLTTLKKGVKSEWKQSPWKNESNDEKHVYIHP